MSLWIITLGQGYSHSAIMVCFDGLLHEQSIEPTHMQIACIAEINHILQSAMALSTIKS
jgi:hypothetical protein